MLRQVLDVSFRLLHPIMPFISEELWTRLPDRDADSLTIARWPEPSAAWDDADAESELGLLQELLGAVRNIRSEYGVAHGQRIEVEVRSADVTLQRAVAAERDAALALAGIDRLAFDGDAAASGAGATAVLTSGAEVFVPLEGLIDLERERARLGKQAAELESLVERAEARLANPNFVNKAPDDVVNQARHKLQSLQEQLQRINEKRQALEVD